MRRVSSVRCRVSSCKYYKASVDKYAAGSYLYGRMSFFLNEDRATYRKWVNGLASALLPGSGHFLSGRIEAGVMWFVTILIIWIAGIVLYVSPVIPSIDFLPAPDVGLVERGRAARPSDDRAGRLAALHGIFADIGNHDTRPFAGEASGDRTTDARARSGDDSNLSRE